MILECQGEMEKGLSVCCGRENRDTYRHHDRMVVAAGTVNLIYAWHPDHTLLTRASQSSDHFNSIVSQTSPTKLRSRLLTDSGRYQDLDNSGSCPSHNELSALASSIHDQETVK